ncbi:MAG: PAS domain-containing protein [Candidatus Acidiferrales bacterium]
MHRNRSVLFMIRYGLSGDSIRSIKMGRDRANNSKQHAGAPARPTARDGDSEPSWRDDKILPKTGFALPERDAISSDADPLHPLIALVKTFNEFLFELDANGKFLSIWTSNGALLRERRAEILGRRALEVFGEEIFHPFSKLFRRVVKESVSEEIEFPVQFPNEQRWFQARVYALASGAGSNSSVFLLARDITKRHEAEKALRQQQTLLMHAEQLTGSGCWEYDIKTGQHLWSYQLFRIYGFDPKGGVPSEETVRSRMHPDDSRRMREILDLAVKHCAPFLSEFRLTLPDGQQRLIFNRGVALPDESGRADRLLGLVQDVTEQRRAEALARKRESLFAQAEQLANLGSWEYEVAERSFTWSEQMFRMLGLAPETDPVPLARACALFHPDDRARVAEEVAGIIEQARPLENHVRFVLADGSVRVFHSRAVPLTDASGRVTQIAGMSQDITAQQLAGDRLRTSESLLAQAEEIAKLGSWELDTIRATVTCSAEFFRMLDLEPLTGPLPLDELWPLLRLEDREGAQRALEQAVTSSSPLEYLSRYVLPNGQIRVLYTRAIPFADASGRITRFVGFNHDITEQTRVEDDLRRLSQQLLTLRSAEQRRLARELHETASQTLTALKMTLKQVQNSLREDDDRARQLIASCRTLACEATREVRTISAVLHPPLMDEAGLVVGLASYVRLFSERSGIAVECSIPEDFQRLPKEVELTIFCVAQEALTNVHRHSQARSASVCVDRTATQVRLSVRDDGVGMALHLSVERRDSLLGVGIAGMRERVRQLQGEFRIVSAPGKGTGVHVSLPLAVGANVA